MVEKILKLTIDERLEMLQSIPAIGGKKETQRSFKSLKKKIHPTDEDKKLFMLSTFNGRWIAAANRELKKDFHCSDAELKALKELLSKMEANERFPEWGVDVDDQLVELIK